jgi:large subunit ribosomal protein L15e
MGAYKYIAQTLQKQYKARDSAYRTKVISWRSGPAMARVERPANLARARTLGYKPKQGYIVVRARVDKGRRTRRRSNGGRKHKNYYLFVQPQLSHQAIAEQRVNRVYRNMEVLNSYWVGEDGNYKFFEVILADPAKPSVNVSSAIRQGKAFRGLTAAGNSRAPSRKKGMNKRLRRKELQMTPYHHAPYVKKETKPETQNRKPETGSAVPPRHPKPHHPEKHPAAGTQHPASGHPASGSQHPKHETAKHETHKAEHKPHEAKHETTHHKAEHHANQETEHHKPAETHKKE